MILLNDAIGAASWIELAWLLTALWGIYLAVWNGLESYRDLLALEGKRNGRRRIATGTIRREVMRGVVNVVYLILGIVAVLIPSNPNATPFGLGVIAMLLLAAVAYNANSLFDRRDRLYLMHFGIAPRDEKGRFTRE